MGIHDSTMRAAVADFVPPHRRGGGYGTFTAIYGLAWLAGAAIIGLLYEHCPRLARTYICIVQLCAFGLLVPLLRRAARLDKPTLKDARISGVISLTER